MPIRTTETFREGKIKLYSGFKKIGLAAGSLQRWNAQKRLEVDIPVQK